MRRDKIKIVSINQPIIISHKDKLVSIIKRKNSYLIAKYKVVEIGTITELEYGYNVVGRCMSYRSRGKITSFVVRDINFGMEHRFFTSNPRLIIRKLSIIFFCSRRVGFEPTDISLSLV
jgi:hypothetical protein